MKVSRSTVSSEVASEVLLGTKLSTNDQDSERGERWSTSKHKIAIFHISL